MLLGFDIGNTSTLMGLYHDHSPIPESTFRFDTIKKSIILFYQNLETCLKPHNAF